MEPEHCHPARSTFPNTCMKQILRKKTHFNVIHNVLVNRFSRHEETHDLSMKLFLLRCQSCVYGQKYIVSILYRLFERYRLGVSQKTTYTLSAYTDASTILPPIKARSCVTTTDTRTCSDISYPRRIITDIKHTTPKTKLQGHV